MNAKGTSCKKQADKSILKPKEVMQERWEEEGNWSYIIDQKSRGSREKNWYQNLKVMSSSSSPQALL